ncbi:SUKH-3 domain-containing protein [Streptomyces sp. AK08-02]|uniref:SUKH-3 domain-containing protein n=1 Tax=Streptomyces sp. AK08-02 TaxID=3028654 RepID=UPI0029AC9565|nr:SUKH-3 domain-containing protein [Streptomyces sp. AK08-02]MDX3751161.1 SUKH-3 domain-containing protein [Streptomyces sp. AK08-02]
MSEEVRRWSTETEQVLRRAGWQPGRSVPTATWESILRERGEFKVHETARRFLAEFGGLVTHGWPPDSILTQSAIRFDPLKAEWDSETFARLSEEVGTLLCPIGQADSGNSYLGIAVGGAVYLAREHTELLAEGVDQALERLVQLQGTQAGVRAPDVPVGTHSFWDRIEAVSPGADAERRWPAETDRVLRAAGWYPGRSVPTATWESILHQQGEFEMHEAAQRFLAEFGCVGVPHREPRDSMPWGEFRLDPLLAMWDDEILDDLSEQAGTYLYPVGMIDRTNQYVGVAEDGAVYVGMDSVRLLAATPDEAMAEMTRKIR